MPSYVGQAIRHWKIVLNDNNKSWHKVHIFLLHFLSMCLIYLNLNVNRVLRDLSQIRNILDFESWRSFHISLPLCKLPLQSSLLLRPHVIFLKFCTFNKTEYSAHFKQTLKRCVAASVWRTHFFHKDERVKFMKSDLSVAGTISCWNSMVSTIIRRHWNGWGFDTQTKKFSKVNVSAQSQL